VIRARLGVVMMNQGDQVTPPAGPDGSLSGSLPSESKPCMGWNGCEFFRDPSCYQQSHLIQLCLGLLKDQKGERGEGVFFFFMSVGYLIYYHVEMLVAIFISCRKSAQIEKLEFTNKGQYQTISPVRSVSKIALIQLNTSLGLGDQQELSWQEFRSRSCKYF